MKLMLFDIDGTLVNTGGAGVRGMNRAFHRLYGFEPALAGIPLAGRTDRIIVREALERLAPGTPIDEPWLDAFRDLYCELLAEEMTNGTQPGKGVLPGIRGLLDALAAREDVLLALLTGNFARSAKIKLGHFELWDYFAAGAFGDQHEDRNRLLDVAIAATQGRTGTITPDSIYVIGDTPHDVACARAGGARAIAVATGIHSADDLRSAGADIVLEDLSDTAGALLSLGC